jgi:hypothetical protein
VATLYELPMDEAEERAYRRRERRLMATLAGMCGLVMVAGLALSPLNGEAAVPPVVELGNITEANIVEIRDHRGEIALSGEFRSSIDSVGNTELDASLIDRRDRRVIGEIEVELPAAGRANRRPELEVDIIGLPPRQTFTVAIDDRTVGTFRTDDRGSVDMELQEGEAVGSSIP